MVQLIIFIYATQSITDIENYASYNGGTLLHNLTNNSKTITGLTNQTKYYFRATAIKNNIESLSSNQVSATPFVVTPPSNLNAVASDKQISLNWGSVDGATYNLYYATQSITDIENYASYNGGTLLHNLTNNSKTITGLTNQTKYYFRATAIKNNIESLPSNQVSATPFVVTPPSNLNAVASDKQISLNWGSVDGATYNLYYATQSITDIENYASYNGGTLLHNLTNNSKTITGLTNQTKYYFRATAIKNNIESLPSNQVIATPFSIIKLNDTGITWGGKYLSGNNINCAGEKISAQDCSHGRDETHNDDSDGHAGFSFAKLSGEGEELSANSTSWSCVKDKVTGLIWEVKTNNSGIHNKDKTYEWGGKTAIGENHKDKEGIYYDAWNALVDGTNTEKLCGFNDWRVPTLAELRSIVHYGKINPSIDGAYFPNTNASLFWSSRPDVKNSGSALLMNFKSGGNNFSNHVNSYRVRLVRGG